MEPTREESIAMFPPPRPEMAPWPGLTDEELVRPEDLSDREWNDVLYGRQTRSQEDWFLTYLTRAREEAKAAWDALTVDQRLDWATGHRLRYVEIDGERWDVRKRAASPPPSVE